LIFAKAENDRDLPCRRANSASGTGDHADGGGRDLADLTRQHTCLFQGGVSIPPAQKIGFAAVHQRGNPRREPLTVLAFNINPEGVPAVVPEAPTKP
jgi:hypothetical protein